ncbi:MAG: hypothetical protein AB2693_16010 [Candidatus Thiodiazotropha sp.]
MPTTKKRDEKHVVDNQQYDKPSQGGFTSRRNVVEYFFRSSCSRRRTTVSTISSRGGNKNVRELHERIAIIRRKPSFYAPIARSGIETFSDVRKKTSATTQGKVSDMIISSELVFRKALTLSKTRKEVSVKSVLNQPVTSVPTSLFHEDGSMRKTTKTELLHKLEDCSWCKKSKRA